MLTIMAVHAHPDDEASTTGGILAKYAAEGVRTVLVTCTDGALGDSADSTAGEDGHEAPYDHDALVATRRAELKQSCEVLGVTHLELLGYRDSGMMGWPTNDAPGSFWSTPVEEAAKQLVALIERYQPDVVITYDDFGFYGHPDHIQAHRVTLAALDATESVARLFFPTFKRSSLGAFADRMREMGVEPPDLDESSFGSPDEDIAAEIDCREHTDAKRASLAAHVSQAENIFFLKFPVEVFREVFGVEHFTRERPAWTGGEPLTDLLDGLR